MLRLRTLGGLSLESDRGALAGAAAQRRRLALLAVLATGRDRGITRDKLVGLLWPEVDDARARSALSQALYTLKRDSGTPDLVVGQEQLVLNPRAVACDLLDFEDALARGDMMLAATLYRGAFLDGVHSRMRRSSSTGWTASGSAQRRPLSARSSGSRWTRRSARITPGPCSGGNASRRSIRSGPARWPG